MKKVFKIIIWAVVVLFFVLGALGFWHKAYIKKTQEAVNRINNRTINLEDVLGKNLPPKPDQQLSDFTVAGFDVNDNGIRDDVELAIFEKYPNSAKIRAAMLQYAQALQLEFNEVFNIITLDQVSRQVMSSLLCVSKFNKIIEIEKMVFNTYSRDNNWTNLKKKYLKPDPYLDNVDFNIPPDREYSCDIDFSSLPN